MIQLNKIMDGKTYPESGSCLYNIVENMIQTDQEVKIDLLNVISLPSMFLNASFGRLANKYGGDKIRKNVKFYHITKIQADRLKEYFSHL